MITYEKFKEIFEKLKQHQEISLYFNNREYEYMIIKLNGYITFQRCGNKEEQSGEIKFNSLDELYTTKTIDNILFKEEWDNLKDIVLDYTFSIVEDKEDISDSLGVEL